MVTPVPAKTPQPLFVENSTICLGIYQDLAGNVWYPDLGSKGDGFGEDDGKGTQT